MILFKASLPTVLLGSGASPKTKKDLTQKSEVFLYSRKQDILL